MISLTLWKIHFIELLMTPLSTVTSLLLQTGRLQPLPSLQTLTKSQVVQTLGIRLSILSNLMISVSLSERTRWQTLLSTFFTILHTKISPSNSCISLLAMIFLGQTTYQSWPGKSVTDEYSSSYIVLPRAAKLHSSFKTFKSSFMEHCSHLRTGSLASHLAQLMPWKQRSSRLMESLTLKLRMWAYLIAFMKCGHVWVFAFVSGMFVYTSWCAVSGVKQCTENKEKTHKMWQLPWFL